MGDTVVKFVSDITIWLGELTILPGEAGIKRSIQLTLKNLRARYKSNNESGFSAPPGFLRSGDNDVDREARNDDPSHHYTNRSEELEHKTLDRVTKHLGDEELVEAEAAESRHDTHMRDVHFYHYVLARELRNVMRDVNASPPKQYNYEEWTYYLRLIGQDEADPDLHGAPVIKPRHDAAAVGEAGARIRDPEDAPTTSSSSDEDGKGGRQPCKWSWLGTRSPLMDEKSEAEWILERLTAALEDELKRVHVGQAHESPPIRMAELRERIRAKRADDEARERKKEEGRKHHKKSSEGDRGNKSQESNGKKSSGSRTRKEQ
jgi:potassium channel subfamily K, other eukaryote